jgi:Cytochrome c554 and c-prime
MQANLRSLGSVAILVLSLSTVLAENTNLMVKPPVPIPGGLALHPVITSVTRTQDLVTLQWFGIQGPYQVLQSPAAASNAWANLGPPTFASQLTTHVSGDNGFFRVLSGRPVSTAETGGTLNYVGAAACVDCHADTVQEWSQTPHVHALDSLKAIGQQNNSSCLVCHTVGFGTPLGFSNEVTTAHLSGVQCENCHGPAANHIAVTRDVSVRPKVTMASEMCGGCHNFHHPTFDEWKQSPHSTPVAAVAQGFLQQGEAEMMTCGPCHSGAVRESLLEGLEHPGTQLPSRVDAAYFGVTCAVCHDAHANMANPPREPNPLLRNPLYSLNNFSYVPSTNPASFATQYDPDIQACAQCHNMRGARWQDTSRAPHHSPQYNILIGAAGYDLGNGSIAAHGFSIDTQCAHCHSASLPASSAAGASTASSTNYFGHTTQVDFQACVECHITTNAAVRAVTNTQASTKAQIAQVQALLNQWATNNAPADLQAKYGTLAWEYTAPGELSNPGDDPTIKGPTAAEQARVPDAIKQARLNLYLVNYDGSFGVHNGDYVRTLLGVAKTNVTSQLSQP